MIKHTVRWMHAGSYRIVEPIFECLELPGAECKQTCPVGCESWEATNHEHPLEPIDECNALVFFDADEDDHGYAGGVHQVDNGPIDIEWNGDAYVWTYADVEQHADDGR